MKGWTATTMPGLAPGTTNGNLDVLQLPPFSPDIDRITLAEPARQADDAERGHADRRPNAITLAEPHAISEAEP